MLAHLAKIEQRAALPTPETRYRESNADDPHERRDDDPAGHGWKGTRISRVVKEAFARRGAELVRGTAAAGADGLTHACPFWAGTRNISPQ